MIIAKAMVLNREDSSEVDAYNKMMKQYHDAVFLGLTESHLSKKKSEGYDNLMKSFSKHFSTQTIKAKQSSKIVDKENFSDVSLKNLGSHLKDKKRKNG